MGYGLEKNLFKQSCWNQIQVDDLHGAVIEAAQRAQEDNGNLKVFLMLCDRILFTIKHPLNRIHVQWEHIEHITLLSLQSPTKIIFQ